MPHLGLVTLVVPDYDEAINYFVGVLGFALRTDIELAPGVRWLTVSPGADDATALLLAKADGADQQARVGDQTGGRVAFFLYSDDFDADYARLRDAGVTFVEEPRREPYGSVVVFEDRYGNRWDLLERRTAPVG